MLCTQTKYLKLHCTHIIIAYYFAKRIRRSAMPRLHVYSIYSTKCSGTHHGVARKMFRLRSLICPVCAMLSCIVLMFFDSSVLAYYCFVHRWIWHWAGVFAPAPLTSKWCILYSCGSVGRRCKCWPRCILVRTHNAMRTRPVHTLTHKHTEGGGGKREIESWSKSASWR